MLDNAAEGFKSIDRMYSDFRLGNNLRGIQNPSGLENHITSIYQSYSAGAFRELTGSVGLDAGKIAPAQAGLQVELDDGEKEKFVKYLFDIIYQAAGPRHQSVDIIPIRNMLLESSMKNISVRLHGPLVSIHCKTNGTYKIFDEYLNQTDSHGFFSALPLKGKESQPLTRSNYTLINVISDEIETYSPIELQYNTEMHEEWHALDFFRRLVNDRLRPVSSNNVSIYETSQTEPVGHKLISDLLPPKLFPELEKVQKASPEISAYLFRDLKMADTQRGARRMQVEMPAYIAAFLGPDGRNQLTTAQEKYIQERMTMFNNPLCGINLSEIERLTLSEHGEPGTTLKYQRLVRDMNDYWRHYSTDAQITEPDSLHPDVIWHNLCHRFQTGDRMIFQLSFEDAFKIVNQKGQPVFETLDSIRNCINDCLESFELLSRLRSNPRAALFELSLLPVTEWKSYVAGLNHPDVMVRATKAETITSEH